MKSEVPAVPVGDKPLLPSGKNFDPKYFQDISASQRAAAQAAAEARAPSKAKEREAVGKKIEQKRKAEEHKAVEAEKKMETSSEGLRVRKFECWRQRME